MQSRVRSLFTELFARLPNINLHVVDAGATIHEVANDISTSFDETSASIDMQAPLQKLSLLSS